MGWNSWNHYGCNIDEALIMRTADAIVSSGLRDAGYVYVNLDDCWHGERDADGRIQPDPVRFPSGMKGAGRHYLPCPRAEVRYLFRRRCDDLRRATEEPGSTSFRTPGTYAAWGVRLREVRLVRDGNG